MLCLYYHPHPAEKEEQKLRIFKVEADKTNKKEPAIILELKIALFVESLTLFEN